MKTLEVSDELYEKLMELANEVAIQDNRATSKPYLFQIQTDVKVWDTGLNGDHLVILDNDYDEVGELTAETIKELASDHEVDCPDWIGDLSTGFYSTYEIKDWLETINHRLTSYSISHKYENGFLTAKGCQNHIKLNGYHYSNPRDYLSHCFRNPEMELIYQFLSTLVIPSNHDNHPQTLAHSH